MKKLLRAILLLISVEANSQSIIDYDGNVYPFLTIGNQKWMATKLRVSHFNDGCPSGVYPSEDDLIFKTFVT